MDGIARRAAIALAFSPRIGRHSEGRYQQLEPASKDSDRSLFLVTALCFLNWRTSIQSLHFSFLGFFFCAQRRSLLRACNPSGSFYAIDTHSHLHRQNHQPCMSVPATAFLPLTPMSLPNPLHLVTSALATIPLRHPTNLKPHPQNLGYPGSHVNSRCYSIIANFFFS